MDHSVAESQWVNGVANFGVYWPKADGSPEVMKYQDAYYEGLASRNTSTTAGASGDGQILKRRLRLGFDQN